MERTSQHCSPERGLSLVVSDFRDPGVRTESPMWGDRLGQGGQICDLRECYCWLVSREMCPKEESGGEEVYRWLVSPGTLALALLELWASAVQRGRCQAAISSI